MKLYVILNDLQIPFHDKQVLELVLRFVEHIRPYGIVLNGDVVDSYDLSEFAKDPIKGYQLEKELKISGELMNRLSEIGSVREKWWLGGNHEDRLRRYTWKKAPQLNIAKLQFENLFDLSYFGFKWKPYGEILMLGKLMVTHGDIVRKHSGWSAKALFEKEGNSILCGHTHRLGIFYKKNANGTHAAYENGCLCRMDPEYVHRPDWQHGFSVVHVDDDGMFNVQQIPVLKRRFFYYGGVRWQ